MDMKNSSDYKLLDKKVVLELAKLKERNTFFRALSFWVGFNKTTLYYEVADRASGSSKWSIKSLIKYAINNVICFTYTPLQIVTALGCIFILIGLGITIDAVITYIKGTAASGFPTLIIVLFIGFGAIMLSLGIIGVYIAQIYDEIKGRPQYIIGKRID
jgi:dolichol-phosphate mannosyltransferase